MYVFTRFSPLAGSVSKQNPKESSKISTAKSGISNRKAAVISLFAMKGFNRAPEIASNNITYHQNNEIIVRCRFIFVIRLIDAKSMQNV